MDNSLSEKWEVKPSGKHDVISAEATNFTDNDPPKTKKMKKVAVINLSKSKLGKVMSGHIDSQSIVLINFSVLWSVFDDSEPILLKDQFMWLKKNRDIKQMKFFAIDYLSDVMGRKLISSISPKAISGKCIQISCLTNTYPIDFANFLAYTINREIDLNNHLDHFSATSMVIDGTFGANHGSGE